MSINARSHTLNRSVSTSRLDLTEAERSDVRALAGKLMASEPKLLDDPRWIAQARRLSCCLPPRILISLRDYRHDSGLSGTLSFANLPIEEGALPDTPTGADSVEQIPALPSAVTMLFGQQLGDVIAYRDEKQGALVQNVVPVRALEKSQSNAGSVVLRLHNENAFHPCRPDLVGLTCLRSDPQQEGGTIISSTRRARSLLDEADVSILRSPRFITATPPSFRKGLSSVPHSILSGLPNDPDIRIDFNATTALDAKAEEVLERLECALIKVSTCPVLAVGEMLLIDNRIVVHGRAGFSPSYDGRDRWLHRVYVHIDGRRSVTHRPEGGPVLC